jgi:hypothetical protein
MPKSDEELSIISITGINKVEMHAQVNEKGVGNGMERKISVDHCLLKFRDTSVLLA